MVSFPRVIAINEKCLEFGIRVNWLRDNCIIQIYKSPILDTYYIDNNLRYLYSVRYYDNSVSDKMYSWRYATRDWDVLRLRAKYLFINQSRRIRFFDKKTNLPEHARAHRGPTPICCAVSFIS